jgi:hypothetical protein
MPHAFDRHCRQHQRHVEGATYTLCLRSKVPLHAHMDMDIYSHIALSLSFPVCRKGTPTRSVSRMMERAMWIASGSRSGLVLMMMERDAPTGYTVLDTMHTATSICIYLLDVLGDASPRKVGKSMLKPVVACSQTHWHRFAYLSGQCIAQKSRTYM